jgi:hypothetical protein
MNIERLEIALSVSVRNNVLPDRPLHDDPERLQLTAGRVDPYYYVQPLFLNR